jgi:hypothetical protein
MTDEINERICDLQGWKYSARGFDLGVGSDLNFPYMSPDGKCATSKPDFTHDPRYAMELFLEMPTALRMQVASSPPEKFMEENAKKWLEWKEKK